MLVGLFVLVDMEAITEKITLKRKKRKKYTRKAVVVKVKVADAPRPISREEALKQIAEIDKLLAEAKGQDPFWYFEPSDGSITEEGKVLLQKYLKPDDIPQRLDSQKDLFASKASIKGASGGNQCLGGETEIYDPVLNIKRAVQDIKEPFHVYAWDGKELVTAKAEAPFVKGVDQLFRVSFSNGEQIVVTHAHKLLTPKGFLSISELQEGSIVCSPSLKIQESDSILDEQIRSYDLQRGNMQSPQRLNHSPGINKANPFSQSSCETVEAHAFSGDQLKQQVSSFRHQSISDISPSTLHGDEQHCRGIEQDSLSGYPIYHDSCDGQIHFEKEACPCGFPLQADALGHTRVNLLEDSQGHKPKYNQTYQLHVRPSNLRDSPPLRISVSDQGGVTHAFLKCEEVSGHGYSLFHKNHKQCSQNLKTLSVSLPEDILPCVETSVVTGIKYLRDDDFYDFTVPVYHNYQDMSSVISANSGKSTFGAIYAYMWATGEVPEGLKGVFPEEVLTPDRNRNIRVVGVSNKQLMNTVLPAYQKWVPRKYLAKGKWSESFSSEQKKLFLYMDGVGEPVSTIEFMTNEQDTESFQGPPLGLVIYDEEPSEKVRKENLMRFVTSGQLNEVFCWTPTNGLSWATDLFSDEVDDRGRSIDLCKFASVTNKKANMKVVDEICSEIHDYNELKMRLLGEFVSLSGLVYGNLFDSNIHVIEPFKITVKDYIVYRGLDPHLVKPSVCVEVAVDRLENHYVIGTYAKDCDTSDLKKDLKERAKNYRLGQTRCDRSADSDIKVLGDRNIFKELGTGDNAIPALFKSEKFTGSIHAGVDTIKQLLKVNDKTKKPRIFIFNTPENKLLITAFKTLERDAYINEDVKGKRDKIMEGKHDAHAALRYVFQSRAQWIAPTEAVPEYEPVNENVGY